ncbi:hypothetical protein KUCAC02_004149, partial [Chaenocephalus aceratus]
RKDEEVIFTLIRVAFRVLPRHIVDQRPRKHPLSDPDLSLSVWWGGSPLLNGNLCVVVEDKLLQE